MKNQKIIEVKNVDFSYGDLKVLENISFEVKKGDFVGLIGPNGSGKTTLIRLLLGLNKTKKGQIKILGKNITRFNNWDKIGFVPQTTIIDQTFPATIEEIISTGSIKKITFEEIKKVLKIVNLEKYENRKIGQLSGGQKQRVLIARALINKPELLILDEPTTSIDKENRETFYDLLHNLNKKGITIILITHDTGIITKYVNKVGCLNKTLHFHETHEEFCAAQNPKNALKKYHLINHEH